MTATEKANFTIEHSMLFRRLCVNQLMLHTCTAKFTGTKKLIIAFEYKNIERPKIKSLSDTECL